MKSVLARLLERPLQQARSGKPAASAPEPGARAGRSARILLRCDLLHGVHRHDADDRGAGLGRFVETCSRTGCSMKGRTASWTATRSVSGRKRPRARSRPIPGGCRRPPPGARAWRNARAVSKSRDPVHIVGAQRHDDLGHRGRGGELPDGVQQDGRAIEQHELLAAGAGLFGRRFVPCGCPARRPAKSRKFSCH